MKINLQILFYNDISRLITYDSMLMWVVSFGESLRQNHPLTCDRRHKEQWNANTVLLAWWMDFCIRIGQFPMIQGYNLSYLLNLDRKNFTSLSEWRVSY